MVKIIPWTTECNHCHVRLEYDNDDVQTSTHEYTVYHNVTEKETLQYIVCPNCGRSIILSRR